MSPTVFRYRNYRFFFFSREETRVHIHVYSPEGEAKFWIVPNVELAMSKGLANSELKTIQEIIEQRVDEIREHWEQHFGS